MYPQCKAAYRGPLNFWGCKANYRGKKPSAEGRWECCHRSCVAGQGFRTCDSRMCNQWLASCLLGLSLIFADDDDDFDDDSNKVVGRCRALYDFQGSRDDELTISAGEEHTDLS